MSQRILVSLCVSLALVGSADAASFKGTTSQKRYASVLTGPDGLVTRVRISYSAPCSDPRNRFPNTFRFEAPFQGSTVDDVQETVRLRTRLKGGGRNRQTATVTAHRTGDTWSGTFKTRAILSRHGKRLDKCELKRVTWSARLEVDHRALRVPLVPDLPALGRADHEHDVLGRRGG
jgi:hypothetical protein